MLGSFSKMEKFMNDNCNSKFEVLSNGSPIWILGVVNIKQRGERYKMSIQKKENKQSKLLFKMVLSILINLIKMPRLGWPPQNVHRLLLEHEFTNYSCLFDGS